MINKQPISLNVIRDVKGKHFSGSFSILSDFQCQKKLYFILFTFTTKMQTHL